MEFIPIQIVNTPNPGQGERPFVYNYAKASGQGAGLEAVVDELGQRFARKSKKEKPPTAAV